MMRVQRAQQRQISALRAVAVHPVSACPQCPRGVSDPAIYRLPLPRPTVRQHEISSRVGARGM